MAKILVADDNAFNRMGLVSLLEQAGHDVIEACDGQEAFARARAESPDLLISDVLMPVVDGYQLARQLRADPLTAHMRLMFYTAYFGRKDAKDLAEAYGVRQVLIKPSEPDMILEAVTEALQAGPSPAPAPPRQLDREHLRLMVDQLLDKTAALEAQQRRIERLNRTLTTLSAVNALIVRAPERQHLFDEACRIAVEKGGFTCARIAVIERPSRTLRESACFGALDGAADGDERSFDEVLRTRRPVIQKDRGQAPGALVALPLLVKRHVFGVLALYADAKDAIDDDEMRLLTELAGDLSFALEHRAVQERADYLSLYDPLTGLPNWGLFIDRVSQALRAAAYQSQFAAVIFLDIERFRMVNDTLGRRAGDEFLRQIGRRLRSATREQDSVARISADHYAVALSGFDALEDTTHMLFDRMMEAFRRPVTIEGRELRVAVRAGIAVYPADGETAEALCANAESALKRAKETGERYLFYTPEMNARIAETLALENRLRHALDEDQFVLHYQPKVDIRTREVAGLEALLRWDDPEQGLILPGRFAPLMEETGIILPAGRWALGRAVADSRAWKARGLVVPRVAVNVSAIQLRQRDFVDSVLEALRGRGEDAPPLLDLEITESVLVEDIEESTRKLQALRRAGLRISVDDFGTGYSSLNYLARLPIDQLKIDRSFISAMRDSEYSRNIVRMIVSLAHMLRVSVIAEGVEDEAQVRLLRDLGCDQIQGFLVSRPVPADEVEALLRSAPAPRHILG
jgi:diguanylate cyclase (GGDEF)-like protein